MVCGSVGKLVGKGREGIFSLGYTFLRGYLVGILQPVTVILGVMARIVLR